MRLLSIVYLTLVLCSTNSSAEGTSSEAVLQETLDAFMNCDVDGFLKYRNDQSIVFGSGWKVQGKEEVKGLIQYIYNEVCEGSENIVSINQVITHGELSLLIWSKAPTNTVGLDTLQIRDGVIINQNIHEFKKSDFE